VVPSRSAVQFLVLCAFLGAVVGCGNDGTPRSTTAPSNATQAVVSNPTPPFNLTGNVFTATGQSLPGAAVKATWDSGSASTVSAGAMGSHYALSIPVAGDVTVRAELEGYDAVEQHLTINAHGRLDIPMMRTLPADQYRLIFTASPPARCLPTPCIVSTRQAST